MTKFVYNSGLLLVAAAGLAMSAAQARAGSGEAASSESAGTSAAPAGAKPQAREQRYCVDEKYVGSRIPIRTCKTKKEWASEGVEMPPK